MMLVGGRLYGKDRSVAHEKRVIESFLYAQQAGQVEGKLHCSGHDLGGTIQFLWGFFPVVRLLFQYIGPPQLLHAIAFLVILHVDSHCLVDGVHFSHFVEDIEQEDKRFCLVVLGLEVSHEIGLQISQFFALLFYLGHYFLPYHERVVAVRYFLEGEVRYFVSILS